MESFELQRRKVFDIDQAASRDAVSTRQEGPARLRRSLKPWPCGSIGFDEPTLASVWFRGDSKSETMGAEQCPERRSQWMRAVTHQATQVRDESMGGVAFPQSLSAPTTGSPSGAVVKIREAAATPSVVRPGDLLVISTDYSLVSLDHLDDLEVAEEWHLKSDSQAKRKGFGIGPELSVYAINQRRKPGGWRVTVTVVVPEDAGREGYSIRHYINTGTHHDQRDVRIRVE